MRFRKLRIAWSVFWGLACVLLIVLWVRSFWRMDWVQLRYSDTHYLQLLSHTSRIAITHGTVRDDMEGLQRLESASPAVQEFPHYLGSNWWGFQRDPIGQYDLAVFPFWFVTLLAATLCVASWPPWAWHFSLRTLLIATTLVAVVVGLIVAAARWPAS